MTDEMQKTEKTVQYYLFRKMTYIVTGTVVGRAAMALSGIILARYLAVELFGAYSAVWELVLVCNMLSETGLTVGIQREAAENGERLPELVGNALLMRLLLAAASLSVGFLFVHSVTGYRHTGLLYALLAVASGAIYAVEPLYSGLQVKGKQHIVAFFESLRGIAFFCGIVVMTLFRKDILFIAGVQAVLYVALFLTLFLISLRYFRLRIHAHTMWKTFSSSLQFGASGQIYSLYSRLPILLLSFFTNDRSVGYYSAARRIVEIVGFVGGSIYNRVFVPSLFQHFRSDAAQYRRTSNFIQSVVFLGGSLIGISLFVLAQPIIMLLMGEKYAGSVSVLQLLSLASFLSFVLLAPDGILTTSRRNIQKIAIQCTGVVTGIAVGYLLIPRFKETGAALTDCCIMIPQAVLFFLIVFRNNLISITAFRYMYVPVLGTLAAGVVTSVLFGYFPLVQAILFSAATMTVVGIWLNKHRAFFAGRSIN